MFSEKLKAAIDMAIADKKLSTKERELIIKIANEEGVSSSEILEFLESKLKNYCPSCSKEKHKNSFRCEYCKYIYNRYYRRLFHWAEIATPIIHIIGVVAIIIALYEFFEVADLAKTTNSLAKKTDTVLSQMKTTHLQDFPDNIPFITRLIENSESSIDIVVDVPAYGIFSSPHEARQYQKAIINKIYNKKVEFNMIVFKDTLRKEKFMEQFKLKNVHTNSSSAFKEFLNRSDNKPFKTKFERWVDFSNDSSLVSAPTIDKLYESVNKRHTDFMLTLNTLKRDCIHKVSCDLTSYFWIIDKTQIAYSFVSLGKQVNECTFKSTDIELLKTMNSTMESLKTEE